MEFLHDLWLFLRQRKKYWMLPLIVILLIIGTLIIIGSGTALAPFIYTLF